MHWKYLSLQHISFSVLRKKFYEYFDSRMIPSLAAWIHRKLGIVFSTALYPDRKPHKFNVYCILIFTFIGVIWVVATTLITYHAQFCAVLPTVWSISKQCPFFGLNSSLFVTGTSFSNSLNLRGQSVWLVSAPEERKTAGLQKAF